MKDWYDVKNGILRRIYFVNKPFYKKLGKKAVFFKPIRVYGKKYISLGENVRFGEYARIEALDSRRGQKFNPEIVIGSGTTFEQYAHITCASKLYIGKNCTFTSRVMVTTISHKYDNVNQTILNNDLETSDVIIGNNCFFGMDTKVFPGVTIGDNVIVGANAIVMNDLPSYTVCVGIPARPIKKYNFELKVWEKYAS